MKDSTMKEQPQDPPMVILGRPTVADYQSALWRVCPRCKNKDARYRIGVTRGLGERTVWMLCECGNRFGVKTEAI